MARVILYLLFSMQLYAQLPEGPGREETERLCKGCHELERSVSRRQDREGWQVTINKMAPELPLGFRVVASVGDW